MFRMKTQKFSSTSPTKTHKMPAFNPSNLSKVVEVWPKISFIPKDLWSRGAWSSRNGIRSTRKEMDPPCQNCSWKFWQVMSGSNSPSQGHKKMICYLLPKKNRFNFWRLKPDSTHFWRLVGTASVLRDLPRPHRAPSARHPIQLLWHGATLPEHQVRLHRTMAPMALPWPYHGITMAYQPEDFLVPDPKLSNTTDGRLPALLQKPRAKIGSFQTMKISPPKPNWLVG